MKKPTEFFKEKRPWSKMKDAILGKYLVPYLAKVKKLGQVIIIIDGFAGCGKYSDGTDGSPLIICKIIQKMQKTGVQAFGVFIEKDDKCFSTLANELKPYVSEEIALPVPGDFEALTSKISGLPPTSPMFIYIDPFGLKGMRMSQLESVLGRAVLQSTEVLINFSFQTLLREAKVSPDLVRDVMGGDEHEAVLEDSSLKLREKEIRVLEIYKDKHRRYFRYVGSCPILYKEDKAKYHLVYATNNFEGIKTMNDIMHNEVNAFYSEGKLFPTMPAEEEKDLKVLRTHIVDTVRAAGLITRGQIKEILIPSLFRIYHSGDYGRIIETLIDDGVLYSETGKKRINDNVRLSMTQFETHNA
ncbi:MAG: three-Cys-motif partner protein TcmP [Actinomycetota bacterium]